MSVLVHVQSHVHRLTVYEFRWKLELTYSAYFFSATGSNTLLITLLEQIAVEANDVIGL